MWLNDPLSPNYRCHGINGMTLIRVDNMCNACISTVMNKPGHLFTRTLQYMTPGHHVKLEEVKILNREQRYLKRDVDEGYTSGSTNHLGRKLRKFTQLKRNKRFDNFIRLVLVQESPFHIAVGSHPVQEAWGSQDSLYRGQIQKLLQCCREPYHQIPFVITIQKKYSLTYLRRTVS